MTIHQNIFCQIFEESVSIKISSHQNFALYGIVPSENKQNSEKQKVEKLQCALRELDTALEEYRAIVNRVVPTEKLDKNLVLQLPFCLQ